MTRALLALPLLLVACAHNRTEERLAALEARMQLAVPDYEKTYHPDGSYSYFDGCNTHHCSASGMCTSTLLACNFTAPPKTDTLDVPEAREDEADDEGSGGYLPVSYVLLSDVEGQAMAPPYTGITFTSLAPSGANAYVLNSGAKLCFDGATCARSLTWNGSSINTGTSTTIGATNFTASTTFTSTVASGTTGFGCSVSNSKCVDFGAGASDHAGSDGTTVTFAGPVGVTGTIKSTTEHMLSDVWYGAVAAAGTVYGKVLPAQAFTVTHIPVYVSGAASGAGSTVLRVTDGTNNCDATYSCTTDTNTTGAKRVATTGSCAFAASATLTYSIQSTTCATTQPSFRQWSIVGKWQ